MYVFFPNDSTFHISKIMNKHNVAYLFGGQRLKESLLETDRDSLKVAVWSGFMHIKVIRSFFLSVNTVTENAYLH